MLLISTITSDPKQSHTLILPSGKSVTMDLEFKPLQAGWFMDLQYETFSLKGFRVCSLPNLLRQFQNIIPFGMACYVDADQEPLFLDDFKSGRAKLYIMTTSEVQAYEDYLGQATA